MEKTKNRPLAYEDVMAPIRAAWSDEIDDELAALEQELAVQQRLRRARVDLGLTQKQAAALTGEDQADISKMESGQLNITVARLTRYVSALRKVARASAKSATKASGQPFMSARDAAHYLLEIQSETASITALKLQKLLYYAQGYALALYGEKLFPERIEAWPKGPVVPPIYGAYKENVAEPLPRPADFDPFAVDDRARFILERVYADLGEMPAGKLVGMTHREPPWAETEQGAEISPEKMTGYFRQRLGVAASF